MDTEPRPPATRLAGSAPYTISFAIGAAGSVQTINLTAPLPALIVPAFIDGWSQDRRSYAGPPLIVLNGAGAGSGVDGLELKAGSQGSTVRGLDIQQFSSNGIAEIDGASNVLVTGNYLGASADGKSAAGNLHDGILIDGGATNNTIGGSAAGAGNVISANGDSATASGNGIEIAGSGVTGNIVIGNLIGVDKTGATPLANVNDGILIDQGAAGNTIGGSAAGDANVIAGSLAGPPSGIVGSQGAIFSLSPASISGNLASFEVTLNYTDAAQDRMVYLGIDPRNSSSALAPINPSTGQPDYSAFNFIPSSTVSADWGPVANPFPGEFLIQTPPGTGGTPAGLLPNADYSVGTLTYDLSRFGITPSSSLFVSLEGDRHDRRRRNTGPSVYLPICQSRLCGRRAASGQCRRQHRRRRVERQRHDGKPGRRQPDRRRQERRRRRPSYRRHTHRRWGKSERHRRHDHNRRQCHRE